MAESSGRTARADIFAELQKHIASRLSLGLHHQLRCVNALRVYLDFGRALTGLQSLFCGALQEVRFVDTNPSAVAALKTHLVDQAATRFIIVKGDEAQCQMAMQHIRAGIQVGTLAFGCQPLPHN